MRVIYDHKIPRVLGFERSIKEKNEGGEMRMLRWISGLTRKNKICNDCIQEKVRVTLIEKKMIKARLQ